MRILAFLPLVIALVFGGFFFWGLNPERDPNEVPSVLISQPVPQFELDPVEGIATPGLSREDLVGNNRPVELMKMIEILEDALERKADKKYLPMQPGDVTLTCADISSIKKDFGFEPSTPLEIGLPKFTEWFRSYHKL